MAVKFSWSLFSVVTGGVCLKLLKVMRDERPPRSTVRLSLCVATALRDYVDLLSREQAFTFALSQ